MNILPDVRSIFSWEGKITEEQEYLMIAKSVSQAFEHVASTVKALHSYAVPEVIALPIQQGIPEYLNWIGDVITQARRSA